MRIVRASWIVAWCLAALCLCGATTCATAANADVEEGKRVATQLTAGPFDLQRRYRSMEGPYIYTHFAVGDLVAGGSGVLPETQVEFMEKPGTKLKKHPQPLGLTDTSKQAKKLFWLKGAKLEVLDEQDHVMPSAEFFCHLNLDIDEKRHNESFPFGERATYTRLFTITQGQTDLDFPSGYGYPLASDDQLRISFQAANRTTDEHRRIKHRLTLYFLPDADLTYPMTALFVRTPCVSVVVDRGSEEAAALEQKAHPGCAVTSRGVTAPNSVPAAVVADSKGRIISGHWVVPPGRHEYASVINDQDPSIAQRDRVLRYGWVHIHPCCVAAFVRQCKQDGQIDLAVSKITTVEKGHGTELTSIQPLVRPSGVKMERDGHFQIGAIYDNTTGGALDSMVTLGLFFDDIDFKRPDWAVAGYHESKPYCGVKASRCK